MHAACFADGWDAAYFRDLACDSAVLLLADDENGFIAARVAADEAEILTLAVAPAARRRGLARNLLETAVSQAFSRGATRIFLEVATGNDAARALYAGAGFSQIGVRLCYYPDGGDALVLSRTLGGRLA